MKQFLFSLSILSLVMFVFNLGLHPVLADTYSLENPLGNTTDPATLAANIIKVLLGIVGIIALVFFIYGGFMMLISAGESDRVQKGRETLLWATIGLIVIFGSAGIVDAVFKIIAGKSIF